MSYTLTIEPGIVREAESCALRNGTTLDAMIRACLLVFVSSADRNRIDSSERPAQPIARRKTIKIGSMRDEVRLPENFDEVFDSMDDEVASMFAGAAS